MTAQVIDGRKIATNLKSQVFDEIANLRSNGFHCGIAILTVSGDFASDSPARRIGRERLHRYASAAASRR
ncbi:hypothetical protein [Nocardia sp. CA-120079]|uniref:hypothetical protein n=1 Tax=Nocardia sp. CA-120079 TaxID=3239974 RepID=UPI003D9623B1